MKREGRRLFLALALLACALAAAAQSSTQSSAAAASSFDETPLPELAQAKSENPVSRFEIVSLGSYPLSIFYVDFCFDLVRYFENGFDSAYLPLVSSSSLTDDQRWTRLGVALGVSCLVGAIDAVIHASKLDAAKRLRAAQAEAAAQSASAQPPSPPEPPASGGTAPSAP